MKKKSTLLALLISTCIYSYAQVNYSFSATTAAYVAVSGGTTPPLINRPYGAGLFSVTYDEGVANNIPIGFTFNYNGIDYTTINICANGFATLGTPFQEMYGQRFFINDLKDGPLTDEIDTSLEWDGTTKPVLAPLWDDLRCLSDFDLRYATTGAAGSRVFIFEWANAKWQFDGVSPAISFELKLYEATNIVEFCYRDEGGALTSAASASIGITASKEIGGGFMCLKNTSSSPTVSTTVETDGLSVKPANNQVYRFTPLPCSLPLNIHYNTYDNTSVNFSWTAPAGVTAFEYAVTTSPDSPASGTATTSTTATVSTLSPGIKYYIHVRSYCSASSQSVWINQPSFITTKNISPPPAISWSKCLGGSSSEFDKNQIKQTPDGGYIMAGITYSNDGDVSGNHGESDEWLVKLNAAGTIEWQKCLGGSGNEFAGSVDLTSDGGYIVAGATPSNDGDVSGNHNTDGNVDAWIVKLNSSGIIEWQKCLGGSLGDAAYAVKQTLDGGYIVAGISYSNDGDVSGNHNSGGIELALDWWIVKLSSTGTIEWQKCLGGNSEDIASAIQQTSDGGYIVTGSTKSGDGDVSGHHGPDGPDGTADYWVVKLSSSGTVQWQKCLGGSSYDYATAVQQTSDGNYIVFGTASSDDGDVTNSIYRYDYWMVKLGINGAILWEKSLGGSRNEDGYDVKQTSDGGYIVTGNTNSNDGDVNGIHETNYGDDWIVKLNSNGDFQWQKCYGGYGFDIGMSIAPTSDDGYIVSGYTESNDGDVSGNHGYGDYWVVKLAADALLPVSLLDFSGEVKGKQNMLYWTTTSEHNNTGFEIQRSTDGYHFNKIGFANTKAANGNSTARLDYHFADLAFTASTNYYRLRQIDKDGKFSFSNIVVLNNEDPNKNSFAVIYPNPVSNILNVKIVSASTKSIRFLMTDISGKLLQQKTTQVSNGETIVQFNVSVLAAGTYFLKIDGGTSGENVINKFIKE